MSLDDFKRCRIEEFEAICRAWTEMREGDSRADWERMRISASINVSPHVKGRVHPKQLLPLPWDPEQGTPRQTGQEAPDLTREEQLARGREMARKLGYRV